MGISIEKLLTLPALRGSKLIAGAAGRDNTIDGLAVIQTPSSINFLMKNNLVITNSQIFNLYPNFCDIIITELHKRGAAGIAIKVNDFLPKTPQAMIDDANLLKFPLIIQPNELSSTQLINAVTYEIMRSEVRDYALGYEENFLREILISNVDKRTLRSRALLLDRNLNKKLGIAVMRAGRRKNSPELHAVFNECGFQYLFLLQGLLVAVADLDQITTPEDVMNSRAQALVNKLPAWDQNSCIALGRCYPELVMLSNAFYEAKAALAFNLTSSNPVPVCRFEKLGFYSILLNASHKKLLKNYYDSTIGVLETFDMKNGTDYLNTLVTLVVHNCSIEETAKALFVHYNTVRYRLRKIKELLGSVSDDPDITLNLQVAVRIALWKRTFENL